MTASFLHGSETVEVTTGARQITVVKAAVIGLVGTAPKGTKNAPIMVYSDKDAAQFGSQLPGFSIPQALNAIFQQGAGSVCVVNVFDAATMVTAVTAETHTVANGKIKTTYAPLSGVVVKDSTGVTTLVKDTDYTLDDFGNITLIGAAAATYGAVSLKVDYNKADFTSVDATAIVGTVTSPGGVRSGGKCFDLCYNLNGFNPKIFIAPGYSSLSAVAAEMTVWANKFKGFALKDAPATTTVAGAIAGRGPAGAINFFTSDKHDILLYPKLSQYDAYSNSYEMRWYSALFAGVWAATINNEGFHVSPSNHQIQGLAAAAGNSVVETNISASLDDATAESQTLNAVGITTVFNSYGTGVRTWGNRSAAYPTNTATRDSFYPVQMAGIVLDESVRYAMLQFIDKPVNQAWIDSVCESVNSFIRTLVGRGALIDGKCIFDVNDNDPTEMGAGHYTFSYSFASPVPGERITFKSTYDINLLKNLK